jgi:hypothetical protein
VRRLAALAVLMVALAACSRGSGKPAAQDDPTRVAAPPHQALDEASINAALAGLDGVVGDAQRELVRERKITTAVTDRLRAIYGGPELGFQLDALAKDLRDGLVGYRPAPGNRVTTVSRMISATDVCVFAEVRRDYTAVTDRPDAGPATLYVALVPKELADDANGYNPTPWALFYDGAQNGGAQPPSPCQ